MVLKMARYAGIFGAAMRRGALSRGLHMGNRRLMSDTQLYDTDGRRGEDLEATASQQLLDSTRQPFPDVRLLEDETSVTVLARVPGFARDDLTITLQQGGMTLTGRERAHVPDEFRAVLRNRASADFSYYLELGEEVIGFAADARVDNGVLIVRLQKRGGSTRTLIPLRWA
jgi:HSP20 family molecular chaperone IbpA